MNFNFDNSKVQQAARGQQSNGDAACKENLIVPGITIMEEEEDEEAAAETNRPRPNLKRTVIQQPKRYQPLNSIQEHES